MRFAWVLVALAACATVPSVLDDAPAATSSGAVPPPPSGADAAAPALDAAASDAASGDLTVWPNAQSFATSDPWLVANHDRLREMRPKVMTINFDNDAASKARWRTRIGEIAAGLTEGSRYHGYASQDAPFVTYEIAKWVDLSDATPAPGWTHAVSSKYPVNCRPDAPNKFDYAALFTPAMSAAFGAPLCDLFAKGDIHEVWLYANGDPDPYTCPGGTVLPTINPAEILESKPRYDAHGIAIPGAFERCAGNGCLDDHDFAAFQACGRTVRVLYVNSTRGPGCAIHSAGHGFEWMARSGAVPELKPRFADFAGFDLDTR